MKKLKIMGTIIPSSYQDVYDWLAIEATSPQKVNEFINRLEDGENFEVDINSPGGEVFAGVEIYTALKQLNPRINVVGLAASAASLILCSSDNVYMSPPAQVMIHKPWTSQQGNSDDFQKASEDLQTLDKSIATAYVLKTGKSEDYIMEMMAKTTWLSAEQAITEGFADKIMFAEAAKDDDLIAAATEGNMLLPKDLIEKTRKQMQAKTVEVEKLKLLKLKGAVN